MGSRRPLNRNGGRWNSSAWARGWKQTSGWNQVGGGLNFKHPLFRSLMERIDRDEIGTLSVAHRGRLRRFGFDWFEHLTVIVGTFSCRLYGLCRDRKQIRETAEDGQAP